MQATAERGQSGVGRGPREACQGPPRRGHGDDGAALVEFALVAPFLFLVLFGIIDFGLNLNDYQSLRQSVREGARQAVVGDYGTDDTCSLTGALGSAPTSVKQIACTTKDRSGVSDPGDVRVKVLVKNDPAGAGTTSYNTDSVTVCVARRASSLTGLLSPFLDNVVLKSAITMRAEKELGINTTEGTTASWAETYPGSSGSWASVGSECA